MAMREKKCVKLYDALMHVCLYSRANKTGIYCIVIVSVAHMQKQVQSWALRVCAL